MTIINYTLFTNCPSRSKGDVIMLKNETFMSTEKVSDNQQTSENYQQVNQHRPQFSFRQILNMNLGFF